MDPVAPVAVVPPEAVEPVAVVAPLAVDPVDVDAAVDVDPVEAVDTVLAVVEVFCPSTKRNPKIRARKNK